MFSLLLPLNLAITRLTRLVPMRAENVCLTPAWSWSACMRRMTAASACSMLSPLSYRLHTVASLTASICVWITLDVFRTLSASEQAAANPARACTLCPWTKRLSAIWKSSRAGSRSVPVSVSRELLTWVWYSPTSRQLRGGRWSPGVHSRRTRCTALQKDHHESGLMRWWSSDMSERMKERGII